MLNLLIIDNNQTSCKLLFNYISQNCFKIHIYSIADNISEGMDIINLGIVDIVIINLNSQTNAIFERLKQISPNYLEKYNKSFIVISNDFRNLSSNKFIFTYMPFPTTSSIIVSKLNELIQYKMKNFSDLDLSIRINLELAYLGYNLSHNGTKYLSECISLMYYNEYIENLTKDVYPIIARRHNKSINTVKCNITNATNSMFYECNKNRLKRYFQFYSVVKPSTKLVIDTILNHLYRDI